MTDRAPDAVTERLPDGVVARVRDQLAAVAAGPWPARATCAAVAETTLVVAVLGSYEYAWAASALGLGGAVAGVATVFVGYALAFVVGAAALAGDARRRALPAPHPALAGLLGGGLFVAAYSRPFLGPVDPARWDVVALATLTVVGAWTWRDGRRRAFWLACAGVAALLVAFSPVHAQARVAASGVHASGVQSVDGLGSVRIVLSGAGTATLFGSKAPSVVLSWGGGSTWVDGPYALVGAVLVAGGRRSARSRASAGDPSPSPDPTTPE